MKINSYTNGSSRLIRLPNEQGTFKQLKSEKSSYKLKQSGHTEFSEAKRAKLMKASQEFEAIFIRNLLKVMGSTVPDGGLFGSGAVGEIYQDMFNDVLADVISKKGVLGLGDTLYRELAKGSDQKEEAMNLNEGLPIKKTNDYTDKI